MTKRLIIAFVFLLAAFLSSFLAVNRVEKEIDGVLSVIEEDGEIYSRAERILGMRGRNGRIFSLFLKHADADTIDRLYIQLSLEFNEGNEERIKHIMTELYAFLTVTKEGERVKSENIF